MRQQSRNILGRENSLVFFIEAVGYSDVYYLQLAAEITAGIIQHTRLYRSQNKSYMGLKAALGDFAAVSVYSAGNIHGNFKGFAVIYIFKKFGCLFGQIAVKARAEDAVDDHIRLA